jgi:hypothetical protein
MTFNTESREGYFRLMADHGISVTVWITASGPAISIEYPVDREGMTVLVNGDKVADKHGVLIETEAAQP